MVSVPYNLSIYIRNYTELSAHAKAKKLEDPNKYMEITGKISRESADVYECVYNCKIYGLIHEEQFIINNK